MQNRKNLHSALSIGRIQMERRWWPHFSTISLSLHGEWAIKTSKNSHLPLPGIKRNLWFWWLNPANTHLICGPRLEWEDGGATIWIQANACNLRYVLREHSWVSATFSSVCDLGISLIWLSINSPWTNGNITKTKFSIKRFRSLNTTMALPNNYTGVSMSSHSRPLFGGTDTLHNSQSSAKLFPFNKPMCARIATRLLFKGDL